MNSMTIAAKGTHPDPSDIDRLAAALFLECRSVSFQQAHDVALALFRAKTGELWAASRARASRCAGNCPVV